MGKRSSYCSGWINCNCCGGNIPCIVKGSTHPPAMIGANQQGVIRPRLCPSCGERYSVHIRPELYFKDYIGVPDGVLAVFFDEGVSHER